MSLTCSVVDCLNKSGKSSINQHSFYLFPDKHSKNYEAWMDAVRPYLKEAKPSKKHFYICDAHFEDRCFLKSGTTIVMDGVQTVIPRKMKRLIKNSLPTIFKSKQDSKMLLPHMIKTENTYHQNNGMDGVDTVIIPTYFESKDDFKMLHTEIMIKNEDMDHEDNVVIQQELTLPPAIQSYSIEQLLSDWHSNSIDGILKYWGIMEKPAVIQFGYYGDFACVGVKRMLIVKSDMSTELYSYDRLSTYPIMKKITCFEDICKTLTIITCLRICIHCLCSDVFLQPKPHSSTQRCKSCQKKNRMETIYKQRRESRLLLKNKRTTKETKNLRRKYRRSLKKISSLEKRIEELMAKCAQNDEKNSSNLSIPIRKKCENL